MVVGKRARLRNKAPSTSIRCPEVTLRQGDRIQVGETILAVTLELPAICCQCNRAISDDQRQYCAWIGGAFICVPCKEKLIASANPQQAPEPVRCRKCRKDVAAEIGKGRRGDYLCEACRKEAGADPAALLHDPLQKAGKQPAAHVPKIAGSLLREAGATQADHPGGARRCALEKPCPVSSCCFCRGDPHRA